MTDAIFDSGYNSNGQFYATATDVLGMTPSAYRSGGASAEIKFAIGECLLGGILVASTEKGICAIFFGEPAAAKARSPEAISPTPDWCLRIGDFRANNRQGHCLVEEPRAGLDLPLDVRGTPSNIAFGSNCGDPGRLDGELCEIAKRIGEPQSARAVARACASNPVAVAISLPPRGEERRIAIRLSWWRAP